VTSPPYNPLDKRNLGISVADALLASPAHPLGDVPRFKGAGIYALYYFGDFPPYKPIAEVNKDRRLLRPIYVGKAIPAGARRGGVGLDLEPGFALWNRINEHAESIRQAKTTLKLADFSCRYLTVDDIWIPLGESLLIARFQPAWNLHLDGFGNHDPGKGRYNQERSPWDVIHPGRPWAAKCAQNKRAAKQILATLETALNPTRLEDL
jgi:hypothetical protein